jgi:hypothetical protein
MEKEAWVKQDHEFKASPGYTGDPVSNRKKKKESGLGPGPQFL